MLRRWMLVQMPRFAYVKHTKGFFQTFNKDAAVSLSVSVFGLILLIRFKNLNLATFPDISSTQKRISG